MLKKPNWTIRSEATLPDHVDPVEQRFQQLKAAIHQQLVESLDLSRVGQDDRDRMLPQIRQLAERVTRSRKAALSKFDRERLMEELMSEIFGLGPLDVLMDDDTVTDILVNDAYTVYVERGGQLELTDVMFADEDHLLRIIQRITARLGRRIDEVSPMVDARLPDGSRVNAVIPPLAIDGPSMSIRRFGAKPLEMDDLLGGSSLLPEMAEFLQAVVEARIGMLVSGGTGAGKTTLLNALSAAIPHYERLVTIEDSAELILQHRHRVRMETRPANTEGRGEYTQRDLVRNALRMRPDRIIVGEVRGAEVWDMLQAMNTGHEGSLTTIHANSSPDALARLEMMCAMTGFDLPVGVVRQYIASGIQIVVHAARLKGGARRIMRITEVTGVEDGTYCLQDLFGFRQTSVDQEGRAIGHFYCTGAVPKCLEQIAANGVSLPEGMFAERKMEATYGA
ncbi:MAG: CpaF family protein [Planctomycetales bacterium]|nr:CpaF family protein [Planctomycetales bacterium]